MTSNKIAFIMENLSSYSGGRYLSYMIALAFQDLKYDVTIYTNFTIENIPYIKDFEGYRRPIIKYTKNLHSLSFNKDDYDIYVGSPRGGCIIAHREAVKNKKLYITFLFDVPTFMKQFSIHLSKKWVNEPIWRSVAKTLKDAGLIITFSNVLVRYIKEYARQNDAMIEDSDDKIVVLHPPLNSRICDKIKNIDVNKRKNQILVVNRFVPSKNWDDIFKVVSIMAKFPNPPRLIAITNSREKLINIANKYNILKLVDCYSKIGDKEKFRLMKESKVIVSPSSYEGLCMSMIEGIRCRTPIVVYDIPVMRHITQNGVTYAKYMDIKSLKDNIEILLKDANLYKKKLDEIDKVRHLFSFDNFVNELGNEIDKIDKIRDKDE